MNDYDVLSKDYLKSHEKPDKKYSMVPTSLSMVGSLDGKSVVDEETIVMDLYNGKEHIVTLNVFFHSKETVTRLLELVGFDDVVWHKPVISPEGINSLGECFWDGYIGNCDLAYFSARKT